MSKPPYGAGIIGAGVIFNDHARAYTQLVPRVRLVGLADIDANRARRAAQGFFIPVVTEDYHQLLARDDVDIISVCTPPSLHEGIVVDSLQAGKFVICEKPLANNLAAADRILTAAQAHPNRLAVVYQKRFTPEIQRARWLIQEGQLGPLQLGRFTRVASIPTQHQTGKSWWGKWGVAGGGALMTQCIHELDAQLLLFGPVKRVNATMATLANSIESEDTLSATVEHESGAIVSLACSVGHSVGTRIQWDIVGPEGAVHFPWAINFVDRRKRNQLLREAQRRFPSRQRTSVFPDKFDKAIRLIKRKLGIARRQLPTEHKPYVAAVLDAIEARAPLPVTPEVARQSLELCTAIYTAAITDEPVELPLENDTPFYDGISSDHYCGGRGNSKSKEVLL